METTSSGGCGIRKLPGIGGGAVLEAGGLFGYKNYTVAGGNPDSLKGTSVFAKDPIGAAAQIYSVYEAERDRPRKTIDLLFERGQKAIRVVRKKDETHVSYLDQIPAILTGKKGARRGKRGGKKAAKK